MNIVADGETRIRKTGEYRKAVANLRASVRLRHQEELAGSGFFKRIILHWRIASEFRRERQKLEPSRYSLYSSYVASGGKRLDLE